MHPFLTLLVVIDPVGLVSIFTSLAGKYTPAQQERTARQAVLVAGSILLVFALISNLMLRYLGISIEAFQIPGGLLLLQWSKIQPRSVIIQPNWWILRMAQCH
jgi:multiple antibiotic resistance protein